MVRIQPRVENRSNAFQTPDELLFEAYIGKQASSQIPNSCVVSYISQYRQYLTPTPQKEVVQSHAQLEQQNRD